MSVVGTFGSTLTSTGGTSLQAISSPFVLRGSSSGGLFGQSSINADKIFSLGSGSSTVFVRDGTYDNTWCTKHIVPANGHNWYTFRQPCQLWDIKVLPCDANVVGERQHKIMSHIKSSSRDNARMKQ